VVDDAVERLVEVVDGHEALLEYRIVGDRLVIDHVETPAALEGHGVAGQLVRRAVTMARDQGLTVVPRCPFARRWLSTHPEERTDVTIDWSR